MRSFKLRALFGIFDNLRRWEAGFSATLDGVSTLFVKLSGDSSGEIRASETIFGCKSLGKGGLGRLTLYLQVRRSKKEAAFFGQPLRRKHLVECDQTMV